MKIDNFGDGWGVDYKISAHSFTTISGTLNDGMYGADDFCLPTKCFTFNIGNSMYASEIVWSLCGFIGGAPITATFCVTETGCTFSDMNDDAYTSVDDDDFKIDTPITTEKPTVSPSHAPSSLPVPMPVPTSAHPTLAPTIIAPTTLVAAYTYSTTITLRLAVSTSPLVDSDVAFVGYAIKHLFEGMNWNIWKITTTASSQTSILSIGERRKLMKFLNLLEIPVLNRNSFDVRMKITGKTIDTLCSVSFQSPHQLETSSIQNVLNSAETSGYKYPLLFFLFH
jgi:hypothetical protein